MFARISEDNVAFSLKVNAPSIPVVLGFLRRAGTSLQELENNAVLKEAMTERHDGWAKKRLEIEVAKPQWRACVDFGRNSAKFPGPMDAFQKQKRVEREVSRERHEWASSLKEKSHTWNKNCKDSANREGDIPSGRK